MPVLPVLPSPLTSVPLDPYLDWAIRNDFRHQRPGDFVPIFVEFDPKPQEGDPKGNALETFTSLNWLDPAFKASVVVPELFKTPPRVIVESPDFNFCVLYVEKKEAEAVTSSSGWRLKIAEMSFAPPFLAPKPAAAPEAKTVPQPPLSVLCRIAQFFQRMFGVRSASNRQAGVVAPFGFAASFAVPASKGGSIPQKNASPTIGASATLPRTVAVAVLDEGIGFAHAVLRRPGAARVQFLWNQNGTVSTGFSLGTEVTGAQIQNELVLQPSGPVGENEVYRRLGGLDYTKDGFKPLAHRKSHGMHVASIATKVQPSIDPAKRPVIAVELPEQSVGDPTGAHLYAYIALGLFYAIWRVQNNLSGGAGMPLVCNISYGPHTGPHDGTKCFERFVDRLTQLCSTWPLEVVLAAGNFRQSRVHAVFKVLANQSKTVAWRLQPADQLPSFIELWFPIHDIDKISVIATSPLGVSRSVSLLKPVDQEIGPKGPVFWMWVAPWNTVSPPKRVRVVIATQGTATYPALDPSAPVAPSGVWQITVQSTVTVKVEAWIGRKLGAAGRGPRGRQSYFDDAAYVRFKPNTMRQEYDPSFTRSYIRRKGTLSGIATGERTTVIGACFRSTFAPTLYTSMGPTSEAKRTSPDPDLAAVGDDTRVLRGVLAAGTRSGSVVAMNGTSVAAPQFAHWLAEYLATSPVIAKPYNPPVIPPPPGTPNDVIGAGCLDYPTTWYRAYRLDRPTF